MNLNTDEIEGVGRNSATWLMNPHEARLQAARDLARSARTEGPEIFEARFRSRGIEPRSEQGLQAMEAYWVIRRGQPH